MATRFLFNETLWTELTSRIPRTRVEAAVAYLGSGGSRLLPLKKGDKLVVDMSLKTVRAGVTDPREVQKLLRRGVQVFSRESLHAKYFVLGNTVIVGSANGSKNSRDRLDEAAILTDDVATVKRAATTFARMCTEPVRQHYLKTCLAEYRSPRFLPGAEGSTRNKIRKLWIIGGLDYEDLPDSEDRAMARVTRKAEKMLADFERCEVDTIHFIRELRFFSRLRVGDWVLSCVANGNGYDVYPPCRFLGVETYARGSGKSRYVLLCESPRGVWPVRWSEVRRRVGSGALPAIAKKPRTALVLDPGVTDRILCLWDACGRFIGKKA